MFYTYNTVLSMFSKLSIDHLVNSQYGANDGRKSSFYLREMHVDRWL